ncbi:hypothetical protein N9R04_07325 [Staphylococcus sp. SQ8-PEA]|uniref:Uncharacterized protein n=1 Tax=Staphylococcus marylandisciuri TaxID=2981529 RepID=A0ABT2QRE6_9STAP|nr:hypothetical protein [Staphylococcus marylandisciuri]MCU5746525.1 hypothetical protein [Staphylococcus marylandisciuri]
MAMLNQFFHKCYRGFNKLVTRNPFADYTKPQFDKDELEEGWEKYTKKIAIGASACVDNTAERIFILISFNKQQVNMDMFMQMNGRLMMWNDLDNPKYKEAIYQHMIAQAPKLVDRVHKAYRNSHATPLAFTLIQYEFESGTTYSHNVSRKSSEAHLDRTPAFLKWFDDVRDETKRLHIGSRKELTWGPFKSKL